MKILIVDDDKNTLILLRLLLTQADCLVTIAHDAAAGVAALKETKFDWLIVDGQMMPVDGFEVAAKAKEIQPDIKTIMISGIYEPADIEGRPIGKIFPKPVNTDALVSYLRQADA